MLYENMDGLGAISLSGAFPFSLFPQLFRGAFARLIVRGTSLDPSIRLDGVNVDEVGGELGGSDIIISGIGVAPSWVGSCGGVGSSLSTGKCTHEGQ